MASPATERLSSNEALLDGLRAEIDERLADLLEPGCEVAFVNFPNIGNVGDSAIWLGARAAIGRAGVRVRYQCEPATYSRRRLAASVGERCTILVQGGGNLGDAYPNQQRVRERVLADFPRARVIQLPQSVWFRSEDRADAFRRLAESHPDFTLMVRDRPSLEWAAERVELPLVLCPDLAFALEPPLRLLPQCDLLWLMRSDGESRGDPLPAAAAGEERADWRGRDLARLSGTDRLRLWQAANRRIVGGMERDGRLGAWLSRAGAATFAPLARHRLDAGARLISRGRVVITDRLHGHVLALLLGIPHVVLDNANGKCRATWESWTSGFPLASWAEGPPQAQALARAMLDGLEEARR